VATAASAADAAPSCPSLPEQAAASRTVAIRRAVIARTIRAGRVIGPDRSGGEFGGDDAAELLTRQASVENARLDLVRCSIFSPIDGIVIDRQTDVGKTVAASFNSPTLFVIANDLSKMQINASIAEADIGTIEPRQTVNFTVDAFPSRQFRGQVIQIRNSPKVEQNVVTYQTIIEVRNDDLRLKPGMTANVSIVIAQRDDTLRVPNAALRARIPEHLLPRPAAPAAVSAGAVTPVAPVMATREQVMALMREAGFTPGSGPPPADLREKMAQLAKERGLELPAMGAGRGERGGAPRGDAPAITTRTVYKLAGTAENPVLEAIPVKLGITDGSSTEVIEGLAEGDVLVSSVVLPAGASTAPTVNPFGGGRRF
jgi:HlyD family secretion protein